MLQLWVLILWCQHRVAWTAASIATGLSPCVFGDLGVYGHGVAALGVFFSPPGSFDCVGIVRGARKKVE